MRSLKHIQGRDPVEMLASVDGLLDGLLRKPRKEIIKLNFASPFCLCLDQSEVGRGFFTVEGMLGDIATSVESCETGTELVIVLSCKDVVTTKRFPVKKGLTKIAEVIGVYAYTKLSVSFSHPVINGLVGYTFKPVRTADETETVPA